MLEELIQLAKDIKAARQRGEETGLNQEEEAFYDALAENQSAREMTGEPALRVIALELVKSLKGNITVDWMHRDAARARLRVLVKRVLRKYGYPPDPKTRPCKTCFSRPRCSQQLGLPQLKLSQELRLNRRQLPSSRPSPCASSHMRSQLSPILNTKTRNPERRQLVVAQALALTYQCTRSPVKRSRPFQTHRPGTTGPGSRCPPDAGSR